MVNNESYIFAKAHEKKYINKQKNLHMVLKDLVTVYDKVLKEVF